MVSTITKNITKFVEEFLTTNCSPDNLQIFMDAWNDEDLQTRFKALFPKTKKTKKDKNAPKRGKSSYLFFCDHVRPLIKEKTPDIDFKEMSKELGKRWSELRDEDKRPFIEESEADKIRYKQDMETYVPVAVCENDGDNEKKVKDKNAPKRGKSSYLFFCIHARPLIKEENPDIDFKEMSKELGKRWSELSDEDKQPFIEESEADKIRYQLEMETYVPSSAPAVKKTPKAKASPKRGRSAFNFFSLEERPHIKEANPEWNYSQIVSELSARWKALKDSKNIKDKENFERLKAQADEDKERVAVLLGLPSPKEKVKENEAAKKPKNAWIYFCTANRETFKKRNPDLCPREITSKLGEMWKEIKGTEEAEIYNVMASKGKETSASEMEIEEEKEENVIIEAESPKLHRKHRKEESSSEESSDSEEESSDSEEEKVVTRSKAKAKAKAKAVTKERDARARRNRKSN